MAIRFEDAISAEKRKIELRRASADDYAKYGSASDLIEKQRAINVAHEKRTRSPNGTFDRKAYQRELMRKRRAAEKLNPKP